MIRNREYHLDVLRILACFMVVLLHTSAYHWNTVGFASSEWQAFNLYNASVRSAVPLFFMLSGKLFLSKESFSLKDFFLKHGLKLAMLYLLWSSLYAVDRLGLAFFLEAFDLRTFVSAVMTPKYHLWYLPELLSVYLLYPILFALKQVRGGKPLLYIAVLIFLFSILRESALGLLGNSALSEWLGSISFGFGYSCGYFILGYLLAQYQARFNAIRTPVLLSAFFLLVMVTALCAARWAATTGVVSQIFYSYKFLTTYLEALLLFLLFLRLPTDSLGPRAARWLPKLSGYTLFVYLIHPFVLEHLDSLFGLDTLTFSPWLSVPLIAGLVFGISLCGAWILHQIPGLRRILI